MKGKYFCTRCNQLHELGKGQDLVYIQHHKNFSQFIEKLRKYEPFQTNDDSAGSVRGLHALRVLLRD